MKYKVGDRVKYCSEICTITKILESQGKFKYILESDDWFDILNGDEMIEGLVEEETLIERVDDNGLPFNEWLSHKGAFHIPDGYVLKDENGNVINATKIVLEKKKKEYPKTYEECEKVLRYDSHRLDDMGVTVRGYKWELIRAFQILLICRDAYWKIAENWKPKFRFGKKKYCIMTKDNKVISATVEETNRILVFPTEEMRDAFYENFKNEIEICKELL